MRIEGYLHVSALLILIVANTIPVVVSRLLGERFAAPIDAGRILSDGQRVLGAHKTWRGFVCGTLGAGIAGMLLLKGFAVGAAFGALALSGDLISSFVKRRLALRSGHRAPLLDQLPEALLPLITLMPVLQSTWLQVVGTTIVFVILDAATERLRPAERSPDTNADSRRAR